MIARSLASEANVCFVVVSVSQDNIAAGTKNLKKGAQMQEFKHKCRMAVMKHFKAQITTGNW